jgi:hypothetical protein
MSDGWKYRPIFIAVNGPGPWPCYLNACEDLVLPDELAIHHLDENHENNEPTNLTAMHKGCHSRLHFAGVPRSTETRAKISAAKTGKKRPPVTDEYRRKMSEIKRGVRLTDEHKQKLSDATHAYWARKKGIA